MIKKRLLKRITMIVLLSFMIASFAGCGKNADVFETQTYKETQVQTVVENKTNNETDKAKNDTEVLGVSGTQDEVDEIDIEDSASEEDNTDMAEAIEIDDNSSFDTTQDTFENISIPYSASDVADTSESSSSAESADVPDEVVWEKTEDGKDVISFGKNYDSDVNGDYLVTSQSCPYQLYTKTTRLYYDAYGNCTNVEGFYCKSNGGGQPIDEGKKCPLGNSEDYNKMFYDGNKCAMAEDIGTYAEGKIWYKYYILNKK